MNLFEGNHLFFHNITPSNPQDKLFLISDHLSFSALAFSAVRDRKAASRIEREVSAGLPDPAPNEVNEQFQFRFSGCEDVTQ